jgi:medium-chain acyl-[acyl-carrier-protein] hydrolase
MNTHERSDTTFSVASYETDVVGKMSLFALFNRFQDLAGTHAAYLHVGYEQLQELKLAWILSRIKVQILSLPGWGNTVKLATWPKGIDRLFAMRDFSLTSEKGEPLVLATSAWLLVDIEKNRPQRIENLPIDLRYPGALHAIKETPDKIREPEGLSTMFERQVWLSDIDTNRHVNNAQYAKWVADCFSEDQFRNRRMTSIQINYLEETLVGDTVALSKSPENDLASEYFIGGLSLNKGAMVFSARVEWR